MDLLVSIVGLRILGLVVLSVGFGRVVGLVVLGVGFG